jgi:hypothetical protein
MDGKSEEKIRETIRERQQSSSKPVKEEGLLELFL